jgi:formylglycine-generating enzyme required for sulfatase activity
VTRTGRVETVYRQEQIRGEHVDILYAIEIKLAAANQLGHASGKTIILKTWRAIRRPPGWFGHLGQDVIPQPGDIIEFDDARPTPSDASIIDARVPDGIRLLNPARITSDFVGLDLVLIDAGEFMMGSPGNESNRSGDELRHLVKITRPFYIGTHEVTQSEYRQVMQTRPSAFSIAGSSRDKVPRTITNRFPVESVSWFDAIEFCNRLSIRDGLKPYYQATEETKEGDSIISAVVAIIGGNGYRLPTEAEWEYACRAGTTTSFHYGGESRADTANVKALIVPQGYAMGPKFREVGRTVRVGSYPANAWGLYDMHGNVAEWCQDWYGKDYYAASPVEDPMGPAEGTHRVLRGGSWLVADPSSRSASRFYHLPREAKYYGGFRIACTP